MICLFRVIFNMFDKRETMPEFLDSVDCDSQVVDFSYKFMGLVNRFAGGAKVVKNFLAKEISSGLPNRSIKILDIGSGTCDIPLAVTRWAGEISQKIEFTCIETNEKALKIASRNIKKSGFNTLYLRRQDIFNFEPEQNFDYAIGSLVFHHFQDEQILDIIRKLRSYVRTGILINDLQRNFLNYMSCFLIMGVIPEKLKHDALLSIRKGFRVNELYQLLKGIENVEVTVEKKTISRLAAFVKFDGGSL